MLIDCDSCVMKNLACGECVVTSLLGPIDISSDAPMLEVLAQAGLVAPLRLRVIDGGMSTSDSGGQASVAG